MLNRNRALLLASIAAAGVTTFATSASAGVYDIWGGGASVLAPYWRQYLDCYAEPTDLIIKGTPPTFIAETPFNYPGNAGGKGAQNCATMHIKTDRTSYYISSSSGNGILTQFSHDPTLWGYINQAETQYAPEVFYNLSETPVATNDVQVYDNGGTETQGSSSVTLACDGCTPQQGQYPNPLQLYGPLVQFPVSVDPLAITYNSTYEEVLNQNGTVTSYHFNIKYPRSNQSGGLRLDAPTYCKIFNGQITNWNDPALTALNKNTSLKDPNDPTPPNSWSVPLQIVGRADSAGPTSSLTRHLANVCASLQGNNYTNGTSTLPANLQGPTYNSNNANYPPVQGETPGKFTLATGNSGLAKYVAFTAVPNGSNGNVNNQPNAIILGRLGYVGVDYTLPYVLVTQVNQYGLNSATLKNDKGQWEAPSPQTAAKSISVVSPPQSNANGSYNPNNTANGLRSNPQDWVQGSSPTSPLANPTVSGAYPIVGTANFLGYTCYASANSLSTITGQLTYLNTKAINDDPKNGILAKAGIDIMPQAWRTAIDETFLSAQLNLGLNFATAGTAGVCSVSGVIGG